MRTITTISAHDDWTLNAVFADGAVRCFDVKPLLGCEVFADLRRVELFKAVSNHGYFVEWPNDADLSADTIYLDGIAV